MTTVPPTPSTLNDTHVRTFRRAFLRHAPQSYAVMQPAHATIKYANRSGPLSDRQIWAHLTGNQTYAVPHAHGGLAHLLAFDIDAGGPRAAQALLTRATTHNLWAFAQVDPQRDRGYVWIPFDDLVNVERLHAFGDTLIAEARTQSPSWKIENRASAADTRLPFARHQWTGRRGELRFQDGTTYPLDGPDFTTPFHAWMTTSQENPTTAIPPLVIQPHKPAPSHQAHAPRPSRGITIAQYNATTDLTALLEHYGAKPARGQGKRLYFCPFHDDQHASLTISRDGKHCTCRSTQSNCPLSHYQRYDAFNVYCIGEGLTTKQALRRLNGLPDDEPPGGQPHTPPRKPPDSPRQGSTGPRATKPPTRRQHAQQAPARNTPTAQHATADDPMTASLPKTARRLYTLLQDHPNGYRWGKYALARQLDVDPRTVQRNLRRLEAEQLLTRQQRGKAGQTDLYFPGIGNQTAAVSTEAPTLPPSAPLAAPPQPRTQGGRHLPPTWKLEHESYPNLQEATRGGQGDAAQSGPWHGPGGAIAYPSGAAYVPPEAAAWYAQIVQAHANDARANDAGAPGLEPVQAYLPPPEPAPEPVEVNTPKKKKTSKRPRKYLDPGQLAGRIIAAERKVAKLKQGKAAERRQAQAIAREITKLKARQARQREQTYSAAEAEAWLAARAQESRTPAQAVPPTRPEEEPDPRRTTPPPADDPARPEDPWRRLQRDLQWRAQAAGDAARARWYGYVLGEAVDPYARPAQAGRGDAGRASPCSPRGEGPPPSSSLPGLAQGSAFGNVAVGDADAGVAEPCGEFMASGAFTEAVVHPAVEEGLGVGGSQAVGTTLAVDAHRSPRFTEDVLQAAGQGGAIDPEIVPSGGDGGDGGAGGGGIDGNAPLTPVFGDVGADVDRVAVEHVGAQAGALVNAHAGGGQQVKHTHQIRAVLGRPRCVFADQFTPLSDLLLADWPLWARGFQASVQVFRDEGVGIVGRPAEVVEGIAQLAPGVELRFECFVTVALLAQAGNPPLDVRWREVAQELRTFLAGQGGEQGLTRLAVAIQGAVAVDMLDILARRFCFVARLARAEDAAQGVVNLVAERGGTGRQSGPPFGRGPPVEVAGGGGERRASRAPPSLPAIVVGGPRARVCVNRVRGGHDHRVTPRGDQTSDPPTMLQALKEADRTRMTQGAAQVPGGDADGMPLRAALAPNGAGATATRDEGVGMTHTVKGMP